MENDEWKICLAFLVWRDERKQIRKGACPLPDCGSFIVHFSQQ